jgi:hypothetical protein
MGGFNFFGKKAADTVKENREYTETAWVELIPSDKNPAKLFSAMNLDEMDEDEIAEAFEDLRRIFAESPTNPALQGKIISISGFVAPVDFTEYAELKEFLLVPFHGACTHIPPPPQNQIIYVTLEHPRKGIHIMDEVTVYGELILETHEGEVALSGYSMKADAVDLIRSNNYIWRPPVRR